MTDLAFVALLLFLGVSLMFRGGLFHGGWF